MPTLFCGNVTLISGGCQARRGVRLGQQDKTAWLSAELIERILGSARRAGPHLIVSRGDCATMLAALTTAGLVRENRGHIVLTAKGRERRRLGDGVEVAA